MPTATIRHIITKRTYGNESDIQFATERNDMIHL